MLTIGTAGWSIPRVLAAEFAGEGSHLERYARVLHCAEINASFYKLPRVGTWEKWAGSVPEGFRFAVKAPKTVTHEAKLRGGVEGLREFLEAVKGLGEALGPVLFQLPPKLEFEERVAREFFAGVREEFKGEIVLEPRNAGWFTAEVSALLAGYEVARVAADPARVPEAAEPGGWDGMRYWRLHGSPRMYYSAYEDAFLRELAGRVREGDWVVFDNTASGAAAGDALKLAALCGEGR